MKIVVVMPIERLGLSEFIAVIRSKGINEAQVPDEDAELVSPPLPLCFFTRFASSACLAVYRNHEDLEHFCLQAFSKHASMGTGGKVDTLAVSALIRELLGHTNANDMNMRARGDVNGLSDGVYSSSPATSQIIASSEELGSSKLDTFEV